jgi:predicted GNAT family acetyltransferase
MSIRLGYAAEVTEPSPLPGDPSELHLRISYADDLRDTSDADTLEQWDVTILHHSRVHEARRCLASPGECATDDCPAYVVGDVAVGSMVFFRVHLDRGRNAYAAMAEESEDLDEIAQVLLDPATGYYTEEAGELLDYSGSALLVMDRVTIQEAWRGQGLGVILAAEAIYRLMPGCRAVACSPGLSDLSANR